MMIYLDKSKAACLVVCSQCDWRTITAAEGTARMFGVEHEAACHNGNQFREATKKWQQRRS